MKLFNWKAGIASVHFIAEITSIILQLNRTAHAIFLPFIFFLSNLILKHFLGRLLRISRL